MNPRIALKIMLLIVVTFSVFHLSILLKIIPYEITWGGRLKNDSEMYVFESMSLVINFTLGLTLLIKGDYIKQIISIKIVNIILWVFLALFGLNTIGNLVAKTNFEKGFAIITLACSVLIWVILKVRKNDD